MKTLISYLQISNKIHKLQSNEGRESERETETDRQ